MRGAARIAGSTPGPFTALESEPPPALAMWTVVAAVAPTTSTAPTSTALGDAASTGVATAVPVQLRAIGAARRLPALVATLGAGAVLLATNLGIPVSTTHTITGAIVGVGSTRRLSAVRWGVAGRIVWAWVITIPAAGSIAASAFYISKLFH